MAAYVPLDPPPMTHTSRSTTSIPLPVCHDADQLQPGTAIHLGAKANRDSKAHMLIAFLFACNESRIPQGEIWHQRGEESTFLGEVHVWAIAGLSTIPSSHGTFR